jgi:hypothetical protein
MVYMGLYDISVHMYVDHKIIVYHIRHHIIYDAVLLPHIVDDTRFWYMDM